MPLLTAPRSFINANIQSFTQAPLTTGSNHNTTLLSVIAQNGASAFSGGALSAHPSFPHLALLIFEAVLEVVCISLPGYIIARMGMFDATAQKFVANLNVTLFTPCLSKSCTRDSLTWCVCTCDVDGQADGLAFGGV